MSETPVDILISHTEYTDVTALSGIDIPTPVIVVNKSTSPVILKLSDTQPASDSSDGVVLSVIGEDASEKRIATTGPKIWAKSLGHTSSPINVQEDLSDKIISGNFIPPDLFTNDLVGARRVKTSTVTREEVQIARGTFFIGSTLRVGVTSNESYSSILRAPSDKYLIVENAEIGIDFRNLSTGNLKYTLDSYVDISNGNTWTYSGGTTTPVGRPLNASLVNNFPSSEIVLGVTLSGFSGTPDYPFLDIRYKLESQGNNQSVTETGLSFFEKGYQIILAPDQELLVRGVTTGDATGTIDIKTIFYTTEVPLSEFPAL